MKGLKIVVSLPLFLFSMVGLAAGNENVTMDSATSTVKAVATTVSDASLTAYLKAKMAAMPDIKSSNVSVGVDKGVVKLSGTVPTVDDATKVVTLAQSTTGVKDVDASQLKVSAKTTSSLEDSLITAKVKGIFIREKLFGNADVPVTTIKVETKGGKVALSGTANSEEQATKAVELAQSVAGVKHVNSTVKVVTTVE